jgi:Domain of unknown function (DUF4262)
MLNNIVIEIVANRPLDLNDHDPCLILGACCYFLKVNPRYYADYVAFARWYYRGKHFPLNQIACPSNDGLFPWDKAAPKSFKERQPMLGPAQRPIEEETRPSNNLLKARTRCGSVALRASGDRRREAPLRRRLS